MRDLLTLTPEYVATGSELPAWERRSGTRIDLHCHSTYSDETLKWLPGIVYHPVLTPQQVYATAKKRGMDFVTAARSATLSSAKRSPSRSPKTARSCM